MKNTNGVYSSNALAIATVLMVFTMVLHPSGGSIEHIQQIRGMIMTTHGIAIFSIPFWIPGFWGLSKKLEYDFPISLTAFCTMCVALFAVLLAATVNGLALPLFVNKYMDATPEVISAIKPIIIYNTSLNHAFDLIFIGASCIAVCFWSIAILKTRRFPAWTGWFGILLSLTIFIPVFSGFSLTHLAGFRVFMSGFALWTVVIILMLRNKDKSGVDVV